MLAVEINDSGLLLARDGCGRRARGRGRGKSRVRVAARRPGSRRRRSRTPPPGRPAARAEPVLADARSRAVAVVDPRLRHGGGPRACAPRSGAEPGYARRRSRAAARRAVRLHARAARPAGRHCERMRRRRARPGGRRPRRGVDGFACAVHAASRPAAAPGGRNVAGDVARRRDAASHALRTVAWCGPARVPAGGCCDDCDDIRP